MTRINAGVSPTELCDQMLFAEFKELPRMQSFAAQRLARYGGTGPRPERFTLNTGHMAFFLPFGQWLEARWLLLVEELRARGFKPKLTEWRGYPEPLRQEASLPLGTSNYARTLLQGRILQRLKEMKRQPTWTGRPRPEWSML